ncbi:MAG: histidine phosphatase family protein [Pirellulaceae bacterium]|nr:histidine phosphatase family protein [Pirellulaceae bacterium]
MKTLILMRHAKSDWKQPGLSDHDRPLNARGCTVAPVVAKHLHSAYPVIDIALASSAVRVQQTLELMQAEWEESPEVLTSRELYLATPQQIVDSLRALHDAWDSVLLVAHNPGLAGLASHWSGRVIEMPTAAIAVFRFSGASWQELTLGSSLELIHYWKPRDLMKEIDWADGD